MQISRHAAEYLADLIEAHRIPLPDGRECLCHALETIPMVRRVLEERALERMMADQPVN